MSADAARTEAVRLRNLVRQGHDPLQQREQARGEPTVIDLARDYIERHALPLKRRSSVRNDRQMIDSIITPKIGNLRVTAVGRQDVEALHRSLKETPYRANRVAALLSKMFSLAVEWGWRSDNPARKIRRFPEDRRERWLTGDEIGRLLNALDEYPDQNAADAIRLLLFTGAREGEVLSADWSQFDLARATWTKPSHHTKEKRIEHVSLNRVTRALLQRMRDDQKGQYLFPGAQGAAAPRVTLARPWLQVLKAAGLAAVEHVRGKRRMILHYRPAVRIHDLRHTFASHLVSAGESLQVVGRLLGHTQPQTTARYAHVADAAQHRAADRMDDVITKSRQRKLTGKARK